MNENSYFYLLRSFLSNLFKPLVGGVLYAILMAYAAVMKQFDDDLLVALQQMNILTSRGFFLNLWGYLFKVKRFGTTETDADYARRIVRTVLNGRNTAASIVQAVQGLVASGASVTEFTSGTVTDFDYSTFDYHTHYAGRVFVVKFNYRTLAMDSLDQFFFVNQSFIGYNTYTTAQATSQTASDQMVQEIVDGFKLAGVKMVLSKQ